MFGECEMEGRGCDRLGRCVRDEGSSGVQCGEGSADIDREKDGR